MSAHAKLSPSSASRWLTCTAAPALEATCPEPPASEYAEEGTAAHKLAELRLIEKLGLAPEAGEAAQAFIKECKWADAAFEAHVNEYVSLVVEMVENYKQERAWSHVDLEQKLDLSGYVPEGFGTADVCIIAGEVLHIVDLKFGKGVAVSAEENNQLMLYALGAYEKYKLLFDISTVRMSIIQPRLSNASTFELASTELVAWGLQTVKPAAAAAYDGIGLFAPSESACRWCKAKAICRARAEENLKLAELDFAKPDTLSNEEIAELLPRIKELAAWAGDINDYALTQARDHGAKFPGYKLVAGRSNRAFDCPPETLEELLKKAKVKNYMTSPKLRTLTELEKLLGGPKFKEVLGNHVTKPEGKPVLVPMSDKRLELNSAAKAAEDFADVPRSCGGIGIGDFDDDMVVD